MIGPLLVLFAPLCWGLGWPFQQDRSPVKNIVLVTVDDMGWGDASWNSVSPLSAANNPVDSTPFLRQLTESEEGATVPRFYAQPTCSPTRASIMTGNYAWRSGLHELAVLGSGDRDCLGYLQSLGNASWDNKPVLLPRHLQNLGYRTHLVGKWHLGLGSRYCYPEQQGFDTFFGLHNGMHDHFQHTTATFCSPFDAGGACFLSENGELEGYDLHDRTRGRPRQADGPADANGDALDTGLNEVFDLSTVTDPRERYSSDVFADRAVQLIEAHGERTLPGRTDKFFLHLSLTAPHTPLQARTMDLEWCDTAADGLVDPVTWPNSSQRVLCGMHHSIDRSIESVVAALKAQGMWNDTVLFLSSDNGGLVEVGQSNGPFTGTKIEYWEGGIRVPALFAGGALAGLGLEFSELDVMHVSDILPTLLGLAGVSESDINDLGLDGRDLDVLGSSGGFWGRRSFGPRWIVMDTLRHVVFSNAQFGIDWNFTTGTIMGPHRGTFWKYSITPGRLLAPQTESVVNLYNLWSDPTESTNLADTFPQVVNFFHAELESASATAPEMKGGVYYYPQFGDLAMPPSPGGCWLAPDDPTYDTASCPFHNFTRTPTAPGSPIGYGTMCVAGEPISYPKPDSC